MQPVELGRSRRSSGCKSFGLRLWLVRQSRISGRRRNASVTNATATKDSETLTTGPMWIGMDQDRGAGWRLGSCLLPAPAPRTCPTRADANTGRESSAA